jgi:hypothetical protein
MDNLLITVLTVSVVAAIAAAVWLARQNRGWADLRRSAGSDQDGDARQNRTQTSAEQALPARKSHLKQLHIRALSHDERDGFAQRWRSAQVRFVDDPAGATRDADSLVGAVMKARGYPVGDFEERAADVTPEHPRVVEHVRAAHAIARRNERRDDRGESDAEERRQIFVDYRALFDDLLVDDDLDIESPALRRR